MIRHRSLISFVVAAIGITVIGYWITTVMPTATERDVTQKDLDISEYMNRIKKIRHVVLDYDNGRMPIERMLNSPSDMDIAALDTALRNAKWKYDQWPKGTLLDIAEVEYIELIYEEGEDRRFVMVLDEYWMMIDWSQESHIEIKGPLLKVFLTTLRSRSRGGKGVRKTLSRHCAGGIDLRDGAWERRRS